MDRTAYKEKLAKEAEQKRMEEALKGVKKVDYTNPEKARADMDKKIKEYYDNSARELMIVFRCYMAAGFTREEAFEIVKGLVSAME